MKLNFLGEGLWAGSDAELARLLVIQDSVEQRRSELMAFIASRAGTTRPLPYTIDGNVATYRISGPLTNLDPLEAEWCGVASYSGIAEVLGMIHADASVDTVILDISSGGGSVAGVVTGIEAIESLKQAKKVVAYTDECMYSAAYWLGVTAHEVHAGAMAGVGSIGVVSTHIERSKMLEDMGIKATVIRAGEFKALATAVEPLSKPAEAQIKARIDAVYDHFVQHVSTQRKTDYATADQTMAQGREFTGVQAKNAGLVDSITSYQTLLEDLQAGVDNDKQLIKNKATFNQGNLRMEKTEQELAAEALALATAQAEADAAASAATDTGATAEAGQNSAQAVVNDNMMAEFRAEVAKNVHLTAEVARLTAEHAQALADVESMKAVVQASVAQMSVAMGVPAVEQASVTQLLASHASLADAFIKKFPVGGVASIAPAAAATETKPVHDTKHSRRVAATQLRIKGN